MSYWLLGFFAAITIAVVAVVTFGKDRFGE